MGSRRWQSVYGGAEAQKKPVLKIRLTCIKNRLKLSQNHRSHRHFYSKSARPSSRVSTPTNPLCDKGFSASAQALKRGVPTPRLTSAEHFPFLKREMLPPLCSGQRP